MSYEIKTLRRTLECQPEVPGTISRQLLKIFTAQETRERKEKSMSEERKLQFRGGIGMSLIPVAIYVFFCMVLFIGFKAFNMEALAVGGFLALLIGGVPATVIFGRVPSRAFPQSHRCRLL